MADWVILGKPFFLVVQWFVTGILVGGVYALVALGLVLIFKSSGIFNFAHGWLMLIGGLIFWQFSINQGWPLWAGAIFALVGGVLLGRLIERFALRPLIGQPALATIMMTLALAQILQGGMMLAWGGNPHPLPIFVTQNELGLGIPMRPLIIQSKSLIGGNIILKVQLIWSFVIAMAAFGLFALFFRFTNAGLSMRATAENHQLAQSVGLRVRQIFGLAWAIAAVVAAMSGVLHGSGAGLDTITVPSMALRAFPAVLLGGLESIEGALVGGLVIGVVEIMTTGLVSSSAGQELAPFLVLMAVLLIRPEGLFGQKRIERV